MGCDAGFYGDVYQGLETSFAIIDLRVRVIGEGDLEPGWRFGWVHCAAFVLHFLVVAQRGLDYCGQHGKGHGGRLVCCFCVGLGMCACDRIQLRGLGLGIFSHQAKE